MLTFMLFSTLDIFLITSGHNLPSFANDECSYMQSVVYNANTRQENKETDSFIHLPTVMDRACYASILMKKYLQKDMDLTLKHLYNVIAFRFRANDTKTTEKSLTMIMRSAFPDFDRYKKAYDIITTHSRNFPENELFLSFIVGRMEYDYYKWSHTYTKDESEYEYKRPRDLTKPEVLSDLDYKTFLWKRDTNSIDEICLIILPGAFIIAILAIYWLLQTYQRENEEFIVVAHSQSIFRRQGISSASQG